ncbi:hypothetical protein [Planomonospora parontospora]|uniref:hypothetical protein n=1 Tax=Planomonospora parontospora TaxID=58119 RepID=UPI001943840E|nr:hypothetical protein [Planomonospora parontospora]GGL07723.1 hypothetical protein GCM10014719_07260 [Planomonospora parontospora subsp. antibiotica]GII14619.1 hypothetical protein Ppa05_13450 [Planomonospora parontospora subsp. antibiotica]
MSTAEISNEESSPAPPDTDLIKEFGLERYRYILHQISALNDNAYKFLGIYQTLATTIIGVALALFVGYRQWQINPATAKAGIIGLLCLETAVAAFTILLIITGILSWIDYRREEVDLTNRLVHQGFRNLPRMKNSWRWYETYIIGFIAASTLFMWFYAIELILPGIK